MMVHVEFPRKHSITTKKYKISCKQRREEKKNNQKCLAFLLNFYKFYYAHRHWCVRLSGKESTIIIFQARIGNFFEGFSSVFVATGCIDSGDKSSATNHFP
jgi:hypothetical protein